MAKFNIAVQPTNNSGAPVGPNIALAAQTSFSSAKATIDAEIQNRVNAATTAQQELLEVQAVFNS
jgi:hypothetical protein